MLLVEDGDLRVPLTEVGQNDAVGARRSAHVDGFHGRAVVPRQGFVFQPVLEGRLREQTAAETPQLHGQGKGSDFMNLGTS